MYMYLYHTAPVLCMRNALWHSARHAHRAGQRRPCFRSRKRRHGQTHGFTALAFYVQQPKCHHCPVRMTECAPHHNQNHTTHNTQHAIHNPKPAYTHSRKRVQLCMLDFCVQPNPCNGAPLCNTHLFVPSPRSSLKVAMFATNARKTTRFGNGAKHVHVVSSCSSRAAMNQNKHTNFTPKIQFTAEHGHLFVAFFVSVIGCTVHCRVVKRLRFIPSSNTQATGPCVVLCLQWCCVPSL